MRRSPHLLLAVSFVMTAASGACSTESRPSADSLAAESAAMATPVLPADSLVPESAAAGMPAGSGAAAPREPQSGSQPDREPATARRPAPRVANTGASPRAAADTVRGIVAEVGSFPMTSVIVRPASGRPVRVLGPLIGEIARAAGAEVWVSGTAGPEGLDANSYAVRTVDGERVSDGVLARDGDRFVLVTPAGRKTVAQLPAALRGKMGARVWLVGPLDDGISSYGILREP